MLVFAALWYVLLFLIPHHLYFHEQHTLFMFNSRMFADALSEIGGFSSYCGAFIAQFFYIPWLGSLILALVLTLLYVMTDKALAGFSKSGEDIFNLALIPTLYHTVQLASSQYLFEPLIAIFWVMALYLIWNRLRSWWAFGFALLVTAATYPLIGMWFCLFPLLVIISLAIHRGFKPWYAIMPAIAIAAPALWALPYFVAFRFAYIGSLTDKGSTLLLITTAFFIASALLLRLKPFSTKINTVISLSALVILTVTSSYAFVQRYDVREKVMISIDRAIKQQNWDEVLELSGRYPGNNLMITYATNLAFMGKGEFVDRVLEFPQQFGIDGLFIGRKGNSRESEYIDNIYAMLGLYNEAHRQAWESMTTFRANVSNLMKLIRYNHLMGREEIAAKFNHLLEPTLFYSDYYEQIKEQGNIFAQPIVSGDTAAHFTNVANIGADMSYICRIEPTNKNAVDYLLVSILLGNRVPMFGDNIHLLKAVYPGGKLPAIYEQAMVLLQQRMPPEEFTALGLPISPAAETTYQRYIAAMQQNGGNPQKMSDFANTYYYYLNFLSPYGAKIITK